MNEKITVGCKIKLIKNLNQTENTFYIYDSMRKNSAIVVSIDEETKTLEAVMLCGGAQDTFEYNFCNVKYISNKDTYVLRQFKTTDKSNYVLNVVFHNGNITTHDGFGIETYTDMRKKIIILLNSKVKFENDDDMEMFDYYVEQNDRYPLRFNIGCMEFTAKALKKVWNDAAKVCKSVIPIK